MADAAPVVQRPPQPERPPPVRPEAAQSATESGAAAAPAADVPARPIAGGAALSGGAARDMPAQHMLASPGQAPQHPAPGALAAAPVIPSVAGPTPGTAGTAWLTQPIPGLTREYLEAHRRRALEEEAAYLAMYTWAAAAAGATAHLTPGSAAASGDAERPLAPPGATPGRDLAPPDASPARGVAAGKAAEKSRGADEPDRMA